MNEARCEACNGRLRFKTGDGVCEDCGAVYEVEDMPTEPTNPDWSKNAADAVKETGWIMIGLAVFVIVVILTT
ncbi:hypothetical protein GOP80_06300 [Planococcaceae bacterium Storch 2/2-2]|nr:hypothetical protein [Planococcaceae bacterium Storch 2/2-2]